MSGRFDRALPEPRAEFRHESGEDLGHAAHVQERTRQRFLNPLKTEFRDRAVIAEIVRRLHVARRDAARAQDADPRKLLCSIVEDRVVIVAQIRARRSRGSRLPETRNDVRQIQVGVAERREALTPDVGRNLREMLD
jgi:hypothetical protein